jgi:hypothetical protein
MTDDAVQTPNRPGRKQRLKRLGLKVVGWIPVLFVAGIIIYAYYVYTVEFCSMVAMFT